MTSDLYAALDIAILAATGASTLLLCLLLLRPAACSPDRGDGTFFGALHAAPTALKVAAAHVGRRPRPRATLRALRAARRFREMLSQSGTRGYHVVAARDVASANGA